MNISDKEKYELEPFIFEKGKNSYFCKIKDENNNPILLKFFNGTDEEIKRKIEIIKKLIKIKYDGINAFSKEIIIVDGIEKGYSCDFYPSAITYLERKNIPLTLKLKAINDNTEQLKFLHTNGYIVNDVRLDNHMICFQNNCGFLVDFEDMMFENDKIITPAHYRFYKDNYTVMLPPSKQEDVKKQFLCHLSLLFDYDFETYVISRGESDLMDEFRFKKEIYEFMEILFSGENVIYFDDILFLFDSEDKIKEYTKILKKNKKGN